MNGCPSLTHHQHEDYEYKVRRFPDPHLQG